MMLRCALADESYKYEHGIYKKEQGMDRLDAGEQVIELTAAQNDWAAFQLLLKSDEEFTLSMKNNPVFSPRGPLENVRLQIVFDSLPGAEVAMYPVGLAEDDDRRYKSDILLENDWVSVERLTVQPVWIEIAIPAGTDPGVYKGEVIVYSHRMFENEKKVAALSFSVEVFGVTLNAPEQNKFLLDLWLHMSNIARKHEVALWSDRHFEILEHYVESLARLGQKSIMAIVSEIPWGGQRCFSITNYLSNLFEYNMLRVTKRKSGELSVDFSVLERYIRICFKHGIDREIELHGLLNVWKYPYDGYGKLADDYPEAIRIRYYDEMDECFKYMKNGNDIREYIQSIEGFFIEKGWLEKVRITADEPGDILLYKKSVAELKKAAPGIRIKTIIGHSEFLDHKEYYRQENMDLVVIFDIACQRYDMLAGIKKGIQGRFSFYVCCGPDKPNTFISSPLLESRLLGILAAYMDFDGFLRWNYTVWPERPRERMSYKYPIWKAGDTNFVYPSNSGRPLLTLRYKNLKRGIEDFELINRVKETCPNQQEVLDLVRDILFKCQDFSQYHPEKKKSASELYSLDYNDYKTARKILLEALVNH